MSILPPNAKLPLISVISVSPRGIVPFSRFLDKSKFWSTVRSTNWAGIVPVSLLWFNGETRDDLRSISIKERKTGDLLVVNLEAYQVIRQPSNLSRYVSSELILKGSKFLQDRIRSNL